MWRNTNVGDSLSTIGTRDHSITGEYRIFGPPGTGKTTSLSHQIRTAVERFAKDSVLVTSFSRAAAATLRGKDLPLSDDCVGTLHSHCWRALGRPAIAETHVQEWNRINPHLRITAAKAAAKLNGEDGGEETSPGAPKGDSLLSELNRYRGTMSPAETWPGSLQAFATKWNAYKASHQLLDFCDLINCALHNIRIAPSRPAVIFVDEAQDLNQMQLNLVRTWGEKSEYYVIAADDDQTIYSWCGATPDGILDPEIPEDHKIFLEQSHRIPQSVHIRATRLIHQVSRRQAKVYAPRSEEGICTQISRGGYKSPEYWILKTITQHIEKKQSVMLLASCSYMLEPVIAVLRKSGIPFHNPYRTSNGFWNPLRHGRRESSASRLRSLLGGKPWTHRDLKLWAEWLTPQGNLRPGAKELIWESKDNLVVTPERIGDLFEDSAAQSLIAASGDPLHLSEWWNRRIAPTFRKRIEFPVKVAQAGGMASLVDTPRVIVGTIHSVKGGEADVVFLFPDLSRAADITYAWPGSARDSVIRLFYVGMTRARETLYICQKESSMAVAL